MHRERVQRYEYGIPGESDDSDASRQGFVAALVGDGRPLLTFTGVMLVVSGAFALFLAARGEFLPHDTAVLGRTADDLCVEADCRVARFMFHDRVAFGGALVAVGTLYLWLVEFPLRRREAWAWWTLAVSAAVGFASFLTYLGYGYLDTWHAAATLVLLPCMTAGLYRTRTVAQHSDGLWSLFIPGTTVARTSRYGLGRAVLLVTSAGMIAGGSTIAIVGMTRVFVPQDLAFMGIDDRAALDAISSRLVSVIAHDRAGFGGAIATAGILAACCTWCGRPSPALWQALALAGASGFGAAILVHPIVGYNDLGHVFPAILGACLFLLGMVLTYGPMHASVPAGNGQGKE